jgi:hypothetical protein
VTLFATQLAGGAIFFFSSAGGAISFGVNVLLMTPSATTTMTVATVSSSIVAVVGSRVR